MRKTLLITLLMALGCSNPLESTTGSLVVKLNVAGLPPDTVVITVNPGNRTRTFNYSDHTGVINELDPGVYSVSATARDTGGTVLATAGQNGVVVEAGRQTSVILNL